MSLNYYAFGPFPGGEEDGEGLHIGQHMRSTTFLMRAHPDLGLTTFAAWDAFLRRSDVTFQNDYGISPSVGDLRDIIMRRYDSETQMPLRRRWIHGQEKPGHYVDPEGVEFTTEEFS